MKHAPADPDECGPPKTFEAGPVNGCVGPAVKTVVNGRGPAGRDL